MIFPNSAGKKSLFCNLSSSWYNTNTLPRGLALLSMASFVDPNIKQLLNKSQNIITVASPQIDLDKIFAAFALVLGFSAAGKNSKLLLPQKIKKRVLLSKLSPNLHAHLVDSKLKILRISFASESIDVEKVNWQRQRVHYNS